jgi:histidine ammonia-lyase
MRKQRMEKEEVLLTGEDLTTADVVLVANDLARLAIAPECKTAVDRARQALEDMVHSGKRIYGVTTGFGELKRYDVPLEEARRLQLNLIRSHSVGVGEPLGQKQVRAVMVSKLNSLLRGTSGVRWVVVDMLARLLEAGVYPVIPRKGSLGASGDLAPLAHLSLLLIGEGEAFYKGKRKPAREALMEAELPPIELETKEGLSLVNGTQFMSGLIALLVEKAELILKTSQIVAALSVEALKGTSTCFDQRIHDERPHNGQLKVASNMRKLTDHSEIILSHRDCHRLQDPYSIRCIPQVLGAVNDTMDFCKGLIETELNSSTDNPLCFCDDDTVLSGGNFHGEHMAFCGDFLGIAVSEIAGIAERRMDRMLSGEYELPVFLTGKPGLNSGLMIAQYTAAALIGQNRVLAHPASVDSMPTSRGMEDHVSMGPNAILKLEEIIDNTAMVVALELLASSQALNYRDEKSSPALEPVRDLVRSISPPLDDDRFLKNDIDRILEKVQSGEVLRLVEEKIGPIQ